MVNHDLIKNKLAQLADYLNDLLEAQRYTQEQFLKDKMIQRYIERTLHLAIECCLDIGSHIIADQNWREPNDKKDIFRVLQENNILLNQQLPNLYKMAQFRNILVHDYAKIDPSIVYSVLQKNLPDFREFIQNINQALECY